MQTRAPSFSRILIAIGFTISCFGLALFLWIAFGGAVPLKPEGYRFSVPFEEATQLSVESDVRISGVSVGKVKRIDLNADGQAEATIELDNAFRPDPLRHAGDAAPEDAARRDLRRVDAGLQRGGAVARGRRAPVRAGCRSVQLDEIFRAFTPETRAAFQAWMQGQAAAPRGRGEDLSVAIASLDPFAKQADSILRLLDSQEGAVSKLVRDGGAVFEALSARQGQLRGLIENSAEVFATTARRNEELKQTFTIFPTFLRESRETLTRLERFSIETNPLINQLRPVAAQLTPTARALGDLAPVLDSFFVALQRTINVAPTGFPALRRLLDDDLPPLLEGLDPFLAELNPLLEVLRIYRHEVTAFLANAAAATNGSVEQSADLVPIRNLRTEAPLGPAVLSAYPRRLQIERTNPYVKPKGYLDVRSGLLSFETRQCAGGIAATVPPTDVVAADPNFNVRTGGDVEGAAAFFDQIKTFALNGQSTTAALPAPPCTQQGPTTRSASTPSRRNTCT